MAFLAIETVLDQCSVAILSADAEVIAWQASFDKRAQAAQILPMIDTVLAEAQLSLAQLTALIFDEGPGGFSGIRINTAVVQALAMVHDLPCVGISSLAAMAQQAWRIKGWSTVYAALDARMQEVYVASFTEHNGIMTVVESAHLLTYGSQLSNSFPLVTDTPDLLVVYPAQEELLLANANDDATLNSVSLSTQSISTCEPLTKSHYLPDARIIGELGIAAYADTGGMDVAQALPVYVRHHAWKTLKEQQASKL